MTTLTNQDWEFNENNVEVRDRSGNTMHCGDANLMHTIQSSINYYRDEISHYKTQVYKLRLECNRLNNAIVKQHLKIKPITLSYDGCVKLLDSYKSPLNDNSACKGIPMAYIDTVQSHFKGIWRYKYRGASIPSIGFKRPQASIQKAFATSFAIYPTRTYKEVA